MGNVVVAPPPVVVLTEPSNASARCDSGGHADRRVLVADASLHPLGRCRPGLGRILSISDGQYKSV